MNPKIAKKAEAVEFGRALRNFGLNILVSDVATTVLFLEQVLQMKTHRSNRDFAVLESHRTYFQLHADHTYHSNPLPSLLPQAGNRGAGIELRLYDTDPDACEEKARAFDYVVLRESEDRPHGLRLKSYVQEVKEQVFPAPENYFGMKDEEYEELKKMLD